MPVGADAERFDVLVLGAGLFGAALAHHLAPDQRVALIDRGDPRSGTSGTAASAGILSVQGWDPWDLELVSETTEEYVRLAEEEGARPPRRNGGLRVARTDEGAQWLGRVAELLRREGEEARSVRPEELHGLLPLVDFEGVRAALFTPADAWVVPTELREAYLRSARRRGAFVGSAGEVPAPVRRDGVWRLDGPTPVASQQLVVACGGATKRVLGHLGGRLPLAPFRAQALRVRPRPLQASFPTLHDLDWNIYARPDSLGRILVGDGTGTQEEDPTAWSTEADPEFVGRTRATTTELFTAVTSFEVEESWAGLCVASPDRYPLVGRVPTSPGLFVASGFNGLGTMRAGGLARRLALALLGGDWEDLRPADPGRFRPEPAPFDPRPEFPLEGVNPLDQLPPRPRHLSTASRRDPTPEVRLQRLGTLREVERLRLVRLSDWFEPLLPHFARDAFRTGGRVEVVEVDGAVRGVLLSGTGEGVASGFTRERAIAERFLACGDPGGIYLEERWSDGGVPVEIFAADVRDWAPSATVRNLVRIARPDDLPEIRALMRAELGPGVDAWIASQPQREETAFVCTIGPKLVGVSWLSRVGAFARGHSFVVHPRYRGLGVGTDLLTARMLWLKRTGGRLVVSEIYDGNVASRVAAERVGMTLVGRMYHFPGPTSRATRSPTSGAPRSSGSSSPSSP